VSTFIGNYARYLEEINIREDKLLLYHCILELGTKKVNVSEQEYPGLSLISYVKPIEKYLAFEPRSGSKSQLYSQSKRTRSLCVEASDLSNGIKKYMCKSHETISLIANRFLFISLSFLSFFLHKMKYIYCNVP
jgi:hypothetical protein